MSRDTKQVILDCAEELFAESGIAAVSLRKIISIAGVNLAAVHYHFGSKDELVRAVFSRRLEEVNAERLRALSALREKYAEEPIELRELLEAFLKAPLNLGRGKTGGRNFFRLIARAHAETSEVVNQILFSCLQEVIQEFLKELCKTLPELSMHEAAFRLAFVAGAMVQAVLMPLKEQFEKNVVGQSLPDDQVLDMLVDFATGGMSSKRGAA